MAAILLEIEAEEAEVENRHRPIPRVHRNRATPLDTLTDDSIIASLGFIVNCCLVFNIP